MKVVCIADNTDPTYIFCGIRIIVPVKGQIYTVIDTKKNSSGVGYLLAEIKNPDFIWSNHPPCPPYFRATLFRPITDISSLERLTKIITIKDKELVDA